MKRFVLYRRVSTKMQGNSGLGLEAQDHLIESYLNSLHEPEIQILGRCVEVESGKVRSRPELNKALALCRSTGAALIVAKLDRLARDSAFVLGLRDAGVEFICADFPQANRLTIGILACISEYEATLISERTRSALAAAKRRGVKLGNPNPRASLDRARIARQSQANEYRASILPAIRNIRTTAHVSSYHGIARVLNARAVKPLRGTSFTAKTVRDIILSEERQATAALL